MLAYSEIYDLQWKKTRRKRNGGENMRPSNIDQAIYSVLELRAHQGQLIESVLAVNEDCTLDIPLNVDVAPQNVDIYERKTILVV